MVLEEISFKEKRIRSITNIYYSRPEIQKALFDFSKNREICPRYFQGFGKRPDSFQYPNDIFELAKKGATSFHCSEEIWEDPLKIITGMTEKQANSIRIGWDLLIDIDCKWFDYAKLAAKAILQTLKENGVKNIGVKFSGSKGFHLIVPWKAFPKEINAIPIKDLFPEIPRKIAAYLRSESEKTMKQILPSDFYSQFKNTKIKKGIKCNQCGEISNQSQLIELFCPRCKIGETRKIPNTEQKEFKCSHCRNNFEIKKTIDLYECSKCNINSQKNPEKFAKTIEIDLFDLMGLDIVLVSSRHLFRMPYSLHEKTALSSIVLEEAQINNFELKHADPMKITPSSIRNFLPDSKEGEATSLVINALDWSKNQEIQQGTSEEKITGKYADYKPIKLDKILEENFPPCIKKILTGVEDGRKRALFSLINLFRSLGMEKELLEKKIYEWNQKNPIPLKEGYIKSQLSWTYQRKPLMPPNCKEFYQGLSACTPDNLCNKIKNPVNYTIRKTLATNKPQKKKSS